MIHVALSIPEAELGWARSRVEAGEAASIDALVADLLRQKREQAEEAAWLNAELAKGAASGVDPHSLDEIFDEIEAEFFHR